VFYSNLIAQHTVLQRLSAFGNALYLGHNQSLMITLYIVLGIVVIIALWAIGAFNGFVSRVNRTKEAWADIDVQLKRRYDLIPNLVETVKGYASHESSAFENVTKARAAAMGATSPAAKADAENQLTGTLKTLFAVSEAYPDLKANQNFLQLQQELGDTEDKIQAARRFYNGNVQDLNTAVESFPGNVIASSFGFKKMDLFQLSDTDAAAREPVKVSFQ
jgi:LemA protein